MMAHTARKKRPKGQGGEIALRKASKTRRQLGRQLNSRGKGIQQFSPHPNPLPKGEGTKGKELATVEPRPRNLPLWVPEGVDLQFVPAEVQQAVGELVQPLYDQFVVGAADGLEKSLGVTITHLLWLEILEQFDIKREYTQVEAV